ncbi:hypothetical protein SAXI111661_19225 [Saccharomonospora xinjiangensis]|uniref:hypothetical protein n=1 Tax=Saccharomonospora xinjiangensis TaxID=75294 RepID=UPI0010C25053|nr:hypothetical protein [Saccharomonospora xinjiangensis]QBQ60865.1 hypothetical protein EYD13_12560 [Saccharomonospora xinjiangensis]
MDRSAAFFGYRTERPAAELAGGPASALPRDHGDVLTALKAWEEELRPEAEKKQKPGRRVSGLYAPADPFRLWLRDLPLRFASSRPVSALLQRRLQLGA